ncbi:transposase [Ancylostoma ceylanicum]|uniref:Transposase n=2 Tax=Ancylostoma ceylanicum TaxID=53326 RepID=A0A0D6LVE3_9BILA|nr:transposase [Ancylostoma ceylanicum]EYC32264.1 hypothetical protein Y032_0003g1485 [Ancylostoma ceylanicum]
MKSIAKARKIGRCVPHALMQYDMDRRADMALFLLELKRTRERLEYLVTVDEKCIFSLNVPALWVDKGVGAEDVPKPNVHAKKVMLCSWWSVHGVKYWEPLAEGSTVIADAYIEQPRDLKANLENACPEQHGVYFQHCNVQLHIARRRKAELVKVG